MTRHGCFGLAMLISVVAFLAIAPTSFAGVSTNQTVAKSGGVVTWTGGAANTGTDPNQDVTSMTEPTAGTITIATTSGTITIISSTDADADCDYDNAEHTSVTCANTSQAAGNALDGDDTVDASGLTSIPLESLEGGLGNDTLTGGAASDDLYGDEGDDTVNGGPGDDAIYGACDGSCDGDVGADADTLNGDAGNDSLYGESGDDTLNGGDDSDYADGGDGNDHVNGDAGDDSYSCSFLCKFGSVSVSNAPHADLCCFGTDGGLYGGAGDDVVNGGDGTDYVDGGDDNDTVSGGAGDDVEIESTFFFAEGGVRGGNGNDTVDGGDGIDGVNGGNDDDNVTGGAGDDSYHYGNALCPAGQATDGGCYTYEYGYVDGDDGNDSVDGGDGIDSVDGDTGNDTVNGGAGDDAFHYDNNACDTSAAGGSCYSYVYGGVWGDDGNDTVDGGDGRDFVSGGNDDDNVTGGPGDDTYHGWNLGYQSDGGGQYPGVYGDDGNDTVRGGDGSDYLDAGYGQDNVDGEAGDDEVYEYNDGSPDVAHGGAGIDNLEYDSYSQAPVTLTLNDQADDGAAPQPEIDDPGDPNNNYGSDFDNVAFYTNCNTNCQAGSGQVNAPATIVGTSGANLLYGSSGNDDITGGDGADYMSGAQGDDTFHARDGYPDYVDCDAGVDTAIVDQFDTVHNCENVDRATVPSAFDTSKPAVPVPPPAQPAAVDNTPPKLNLNVSDKTLTPGQLIAGVKVSFSCNEDCALSLRLLAQQSSGRATFSRARGYNVVVGRRSVGFGKSKRNLKVRPCERKQGGPQSKACLKRFNKALNARLKKTGKVTMKLRAVAADRAGNRVTKVTTVTIRKPRK